jgi:hypothetical protein
MARINEQRHRVPGQAFKADRGIAEESVLHREQWHLSSDIENRATGDIEM